MGLWSAAPRETGDEVMTPAETAALLKLDEPAVLAAAQGGDLPSRQIGGHWRFSRRAILAWLGGDDQRLDPYRDQQRHDLPGRSRAKSAR
jgi:excisionase family DNA binding protein